MSGMKMMTLKIGGLTCDFFFMYVHIAADQKETFNSPLARFQKWTHSYASVMHIFRTDYLTQKLSRL